MADREDELGRTATAPASSSAPAIPAAPVGATLGRYRLERELGSGGMGVVHAAFDPDLERRIALKVLRTAETDDARGRLLREARAMARLAHPNVVTVHEVGSASGRDYVAMELIVGETLADWLRATPRDPHAILQAFVDAGRGLAAAHAAGIVHRDFKPHNVLRSRESRIVVTDFGLARSSEPDPMTATVPLRSSKPVIGESTPSSLSGLTQTGSVLGTPAYMAPEQWNGATVTPATDQFAYCVAMWEALAGERPYRATTAEALRDEVCAGPAALDASKIPRRMRRILRRGLDPVPAKRWPSMDALIAAIVRAERRPVVAIAIGGGALAIAAIVYVAMRPAAAPDVPPCAPPPRDPATVWSAPLAAELSPEIGAVFAKDFERWQSARTTACAAPEAERSAQLRCLDSVMLRFDAVRRAIQRVQHATDDDAAQLLVEPAVCMTADPPRLAIGASADTVRAFELYARTLSGDLHPPEQPVAELLDHPDLDPCVRALAELAMAGTAREMPKKRGAVTEALQASEQCADDHLRAEANILATPYNFELPIIGPKGLAAIQRAEAAAKRVGDADLLAPVDMLRGIVASQQENWTETFARFDKAIAEYGERGLVRRQVRAVTHANALHFQRSEPADVAAIAAAIAKWQPIAVKLHDTPDADQLVRDGAELRFDAGDIAGAHDAVATIPPPHPDPASPKQRVEGTVTDRAGKPVGGATVTLALRVEADALGILPELGLFEPDRHVRTATTDPGGHFAIDDAPTDGAAVAQLADRRSLPVALGAHVALVLDATRKVTGTVALGDVSSTKIAVVMEVSHDAHDHYRMTAPVTPDGRFALAGVPTGKVEISVVIPTGHHGGQSASKLLPAGTADVTDFALVLPAKGRPIDVIVRSQLPVPLDIAQILVVAGKVNVTNIAELMKRMGGDVQNTFAHAVVGEKVPQALMTKVRPGDLLSHIDHAPLGDITVCAIGLNGDMMDRAAMAKIQAHVGELAIKCETLGPDDAVVTLETPPQKRFD